MLKLIAGILLLSTLAGCTIVVNSDNVDVSHSYPVNLKENG